MGQQIFHNPCVHLPIQTQLLKAKYQDETKQVDDHLIDRDRTRSIFMQIHSFVNKKTEKFCSFFSLFFSQIDFMLFLSCFLRF